MRTIDIRYVFRLSGGEEEVFLLSFDEMSLDLLKDSPHDPPPWTDLAFHQCPHCPLNADAHHHCPAALNMIDIVKRCTKLTSFENIHVDVVTPQRVVSQDTTVQRAVSALTGLVMATSGCPHMAFFKPMARFHLPLATIDETIYRAASMYLLAQFFLKRRGREVDFELAGLKSIYEKIENVNSAMARRLCAAMDNDAAVNALTNLDIFAKMVPFAVERSLDVVEHLFSHYLLQSDTPCRQNPVESWSPRRQNTLGARQEQEPIGAMIESPLSAGSI